MNLVEPTAIEDEESTLGAMMLSKEAADVVVEMLAEADFYWDKHRTIYRIICDTYAHENTTDERVICGKLANLGLLESVGNLAYVITLTDSCPNPYNAKHYARRVKDAAISREIIKTGHTLVNLGHQNSPVEERLAESEALVYQIGGASRSEEVVALAEPARESLRLMMDARQTGNVVSGISTPWREVDNITGGFNAGEMIVVGARSSMGKTAFSLDILLHAALEGKPVLLFSLEMSRSEISTRLLCSLAHVDLWKFKNNPISLGQEELNRLKEAYSRIEKAPFYVDDKADRSLNEINSIARRRVRAGAQIVAIDYIQLMYGSSRTESRTQEMAKIANEIKVMARELNVPVIVSSQLRKKAIGAKAEPSLEDLKESSAIEQACDIGLLLYRPEVDNDDASLKGVANIHIAKNRNGRTGKCTLAWVGEWTTFLPMGQGEEE